MAFFKSMLSLLALVGSMSTHAGGDPEDIQQLRNLLQPITSLAAQFEQQITDANGLSYKVPKVCSKWPSPTVYAGQSSTPCLSR